MDEQVTVALVRFTRRGAPPRGPAEVHAEARRIAEQPGPTPLPDPDGAHRRSGRTAVLATIAVVGAIVLGVALGWGRSDGDDADDVAAIQGAGEASDPTSTSVPQPSPLASVDVNDAPVGSGAQAPDAGTRERFETGWTAVGIGGADYGWVPTEFMMRKEAGSVSPVVDEDLEILGYYISGLTYFPREEFEDPAFDWEQAVREKLTACCGEEYADQQILPVLAAGGLKTVEPIPEPLVQGGG